MSGEYKRRGRLEKTILCAVTVMAIFFGVLLLGSYFRYLNVACPLSRDSSLLIDILHGEARVTYDSVSAPRFKVTTRPAYRGKPMMQYSWMRFAQYQGLEPLFPVPLSIVFLGFSAWPIVAFCLWHRQRYPVGHCPACGYDLRGSVGSVSCPECGAGILGVGKKACKSKSREAASG